MSGFSKLRNIQYAALFKSSEYKNQLKSTVKDIMQGCEKADNEASVVSIFELELFHLLKKDLGITYYPEKEKKVDTERHISHGRIDSKINALIIEYKHPSKLMNEKHEKKATQQIINYLEGMYKKDGKDCFGVVTDGIRIQFIKSEKGIITTTVYETLNYRHLDTIIKNIILLEKTALTSSNLVTDFCEDEKKAYKLVRTLFQALSLNPTRKTLMLQNEWQELFRLAHDDETKQATIQARRKSLEVIIDEPITTNEQEFAALFSLQTAYAIIIKVIAYKVISKIKYRHSFMEFNSMVNVDDEVLRIQLEGLEEGALFRSLGIGNLLEGDFFSWYCS